ncbi:zinc finger protein 583 isoform X7 [Lutra lutra]|uniref:zinc finger protein 583 isoform X7 n=1 Tax=Lutra lutra TaxID=9657 RepID=UPI001FD45379|nr:zinc finger protein 583 isoform X7 [Lutra lutra]
MPCAASGPDSTSQRPLRPAPLPARAPRPLCEPAGPAESEAPPRPAGRWAPGGRRRGGRCRPAGRRRVFMCVRGQLAYCVLSTSRRDSCYRARSYAHHYAKCLLWTVSGSSRQRMGGRYHFTEEETEVWSGYWVMQVAELVRGGR